MFGFTMLSANTLNSLWNDGDGSFFPDALLKNISGFDKNTNLEGSDLLDVHRYQAGGITYEQKVYGLEDKSIFVDTIIVPSTEIKEAEQALQKAIAEQRFEDAAVLRDKIEALKTK